MNITSDQGTHAEVEEWAAKNATRCRFHPPYSPTAADLTERLLDQLTVEMGTCSQLWIGRLTQAQERSLSIPGAIVPVPTLC